jgi:hypothetical protein
MLGNRIIYTAKVIALTICTTLFGCSPENLGFSDVPFISLESVAVLSDLQGKDSIIQVTIYYQDGDGDIGLSSEDNSAPFNQGSPYSHNLPVTYLVKNSVDSFVQLRKSNGELYGNQHERIPVITPTGKYKSISGTLQINLPANPISLDPEIVKLEIKLIDRALNVSNTLTTEVLQLNH